MIEFLREKVTASLSEEQEKLLASSLSNQYNPILGSASAKFKELLGQSGKEKSNTPGDLFILKDSNGKNQKFFYYFKTSSGLEIGSFASGEISTDYNAFAQSVLSSLGSDAQRRRISSINPTFSFLYQEWGKFSIPEEERLAARMLFDAQVRSWFQDLIKSERKQWTESPEELSKMLLDQMEKQGMLKSQFSIFCSQTGNQMMMVESVEAIEEATKQGFKCFTCGRSFSEEKQIRFISPTPFGKKIATPHYWLVLQACELLEPFIPQDKICVVFEKDSASVIANVETSLLLLEVKDTPYRLKDAFLFSQKIALYKPAASCILTNSPLNPEVMQYLESALPDCFYKTAESSDQLKEALPLLLQKAQERHLQEILSPFMQLSVLPIDFYALNYFFPGGEISIPESRPTVPETLPSVEEAVPPAPQSRPTKEEKREEILETLPKEILEFEPRDMVVRKSSKTEALEKILGELRKGGAGRESSLHILLQDLNDADKRSKACLVSKDGLVIASTLSEETSEIFASYGTDCFSKAQSIQEQKSFSSLQSLFMASQNFSLQIYPVSEFYLIVATTLETVMIEPLPETSLPEALKQICDRLLAKRGIEGVGILNSTGEFLCQAGKEIMGKTFLPPDFLPLFSGLSSSFSQIGQGDLECVGLQTDSEQQTLFRSEKGYLLARFEMNQPLEDIVPEVLSVTQDVSQILKSSPV